MSCRLLLRQPSARAGHITPPLPLSRCVSPLSSTSATSPCCCSPSLSCPLTSSSSPCCCSWSNSHLFSVLPILFPLLPLSSTSSTSPLSLSLSSLSLLLSLLLLLLLLPLSLQHTRRSGDELGWALLDEDARAGWVTHDPEATHHSAEERSKEGERERPGIGSRARDSSQDPSSGRVAL
jgi:hypothetical protein